MSKAVYLIHSSSAPRRLVSAARLETKTVRWLFFCQDYRHGLRWRKALGKQFERSSIRASLAAASASLRSPFLDLITAAGRKNQSLAWWASRLAERNTAGNWLFLYCCYFAAACKELGSVQGPVAIVAESWAVLSSVEKYARREGFDVRWAARSHFGHQFAKPFLMACARLSWFTVRSFRRSLMAGSVPILPPDQPRVLLHTFLDEGCLGENGMFRERYFPGLREWLENNKISVAHLPVLYNMKRSDRSAWRWLARNPARFINSYRLYHLTDYLFSMSHAARGRRFDFDCLMLNGLDVSGIFEEVQRAGMFDLGSLEALLSYRLPLRLAERGIHFELMIAEYENMIPEKLLIAGFRRFSPETKLVGFQHGALYPMLLCNFVTPGEAQIAPLPDRVVCNGPFFRDILVREGLPPHRAVSGPALRYRHLWSNERPCEAIARKVAVVPLPLMLSDAVELLSKLVEAFNDEPGVRVVLKPHPMSSLSRIRFATGIATFPSNLEFVDQDIAALLKDAALVIALSSSALYEALAAGVPVIAVGREASVDLNPLGWYPRLSVQFCEPAEIRAEALRLLSLPEHELISYRAYAKEILADSFGKVDDDTMRTFVDGLLPYDRYQQAA